MKKIYYCILMLAVCMLSSCFDDDGNYDYTTVDEILIEGLGESYTLNSYNGEVLEISPKITSKYADLTYEWWMWSPDEENKGSTNWEEEEPYEAELISTERDLHYTVECPIGLYTIMLKVTSASNGYFSMATTSLNAQTMFTRGFYVLKETADGNTELDLYNRDGEMMTDLLEATQNGPMQGKPLSLGALQAHSMLGEDNESKAVHTLCVTTEDRQIAFFNTEDLEKVHDAASIVTGGLDASVVPYTAFTFGNSNYLLTSEGCNVAYISSMMPTSGAIGVPTRTGGGSQFVMSDGDYCAYYWNNEESRIDCTDNIQFGDLYTYDENGFSTAGMECLMCGLSQTDAKGYFLLEDAGGQRYIYEMEAPVIGAFAPSPRTIGRQEIPADSKLASATAFAVNARTTNLLYFISDNQLYTYNLSNYTENPTPVTLSGIGAGEAITYLSYQWQDYTNDVENNFVHLVVGTQNGDNYKLYMYDIEAGIPRTLVRSFGGKGKVKMCVYMSPVLYNAMQNSMQSSDWCSNSLPN